MNNNCVQNEADITNAELLKELRTIKELSAIGVKECLTIAETALITDLSKSHLYRLIMQKSIPYYKADKRVYFKKSEIENWLLDTARRVKPISDVESEVVTKSINRKKKGV